MPALHPTLAIVLFLVLIKVAIFLIVRGSGPVRTDRNKRGRNLRRAARELDDIGSDGGGGGGGD